jgi:GNAT superfamily N-acetyltransferase
MNSPGTATPGIAPAWRPIDDPNEPPGLRSAPLPALLPENLDNLTHYSSAWGVRRFDGDWLPELTFGAYGYLSLRGVAAIRERLERLSVDADTVVLFRGQKRLTADLNRVPSDPEERRRVIGAELEAAAERRLRKIGDLRRYEALMQLSPGTRAAFEYDTGLWRDATLLDALVAEHQASSGNRLLVSASRSLAVAAGNYNMRTADNRNRYIYLLAVPKKAAVNVYAKDRTFARTEKAMAYHDVEREITVWLDATPYIVGVYDAADDRWV